MSVTKWLSQGLFGVAVALAAGALLCGPMGGTARANAPGDDDSKDTFWWCTCTTDTCTTNPIGPCCNGTCNCDYNSCGCKANARVPSGASCK